MKPLLFLLMAGCAFGQNTTGVSNITSGCINNAETGRRECPKKPAGQKPAKPTQKAVEMCCSIPSIDGGGVGGPIPDQAMIDALNKAEGTEPVCQGNFKPYRSGGIWICDPSGPIDVPAIQEGRDCDKDPIEICGRNSCTDAEVERKCVWTPHWTCADPSRFLLASVDGKKHICHREQP